MKKYDCLIVGAGLFGTVFAYEAAARCKKCIDIDKRDRAGGRLGQYKYYDMDKVIISALEAVEAEPREYFNKREGVLCAFKE